MNLDKGPKRNRRGFLKDALSFGASAAISAFPAAPTLTPAFGVILFLGQDYLLPKSIKEKITKELKESESKYVYLRTRRKDFLNIGVLHINEAIEDQLNKTILGQAIRQADVILLEAPIQGGYFEKLKEYAQNPINDSREDNDFKKVVLNMDPSNGAIQQGMQYWASISAGYRSMKFFGKDLVALGLSSKEKKKVRIDYLFYVLKTLGIAQLGLFTPTDMVSFLIRQKSDKYQDYLNPSHVIDGRTVFMTLEALKAMKKYPGRKIVCVSGDGHAVGIEYYLNEARGQLEFKSYLYNLIYGIFKFLPI